MRFESPKGQSDRGERRVPFGKAVIDVEKGVAIPADSEEGEKLLIEKWRREGRAALEKDARMRDVVSEMADRSHESPVVTIQREIQMLQKLLAENMRRLYSATERKEGNLGNATFHIPDLSDPERAKAEMDRQRAAYQEMGRIQVEELSATTEQIKKDISLLESGIAELIQQRKPSPEFVDAISRLERRVAFAVQQSVDISPETDEYRMPRIRLAALARLRATLEKGK